MLRKKIKHFSLMFFLVVTTLSFYTCDDKDTAQVVIDLPSMQCKTCKINIESALYNLKGVSYVHVSIKEKIAEINFDTAKTSLTTLEKTITGIGYDANDKKADSTAYMNLKDCCKLPKDQKEKHTR